MHSYEKLFILYLFKELLRLLFLCLLLHDALLCMEKENAQIN